MKWEKFVEDVGTDDETESYELKFRLLVVDVSKLTRHKIWVGRIFRGDQLLMIDGNEGVQDENLLKCQMKSIVAAINILNQDAAKMAELMSSMHDEAIKAGWIETSPE